MVAVAAIKVNAVLGSNTDVPINVLVSLTNNSNTDVTTWTWTIVDQPPGTADVLSSTSSSTPTFTPKKEGTYLLRLTVNATLADEDTDQVVVAVRQIKTRTRVPAFTETLEADAAGDGWATSIDTTLRLLDTMRADPGLSVGVAGVALTRGEIVRCSGVSLLKATLPGEESVPTYTLALANVEANMNELLGVVEGNPSGGASASIGTPVVVRWFGLLLLVTFAAAVGDKVFVSNTGVLSLTAGTTRRLLGRVVAVSGGSASIFFDGRLFDTTPIVSPAQTEAYAGAQADMNGANNIGTGVTFKKTFPAAPATITFTILDSNNIAGPTLTAYQVTTEGCGVYGTASGAGNTRFYARVFAS